MRTLWTWQGSQAVLPNTAEAPLNLSRQLRRELVRRLAAVCGKHFEALPCVLASLAPHASVEAWQHVEHALMTLFGEVDRYMTEVAGAPQPDARERFELEVAQRTIVGRIRREYLQRLDRGESVQEAARHALEPIRDTFLGEPSVLS